MKLEDIEVGSHYVYKNNDAPVVVFKVERITRISRSTNRRMITCTRSDRNDVLNKYTFQAAYLARKATPAEIKEALLKTVK